MCFRTGEPRLPTIGAKQTTVMKTNLALIIPAFAVFADTALCATVYNIDIGVNTTTLLKAGYTGLTGSNGATATIDGRVFTLGISAPGANAASGSRNRGVAGAPTGIDEVTADFTFAQSDPGGVQVTLNLGTAGALQAGTWQMSVYSADWNVGLDGTLDQRIGIITTTGVTTSEVTYGAAVDQVFNGPATTFTFTSDGVSAYSLFVRDSLASTLGSGADDAVRFNGIDLVLIPEPSTALLGAIGFLALLRRRR